MKCCLSLKRQLDVVNELHKDVNTKDEKEMNNESKNSSDEEDIVFE